MGPVLGRLVSLTFDKKRMTSRVLTRHCQEWDFVKQLKPVGYMHDYQLEKILACLYGPGQKNGKTKIEILQLPCGKQGGENKRDE